MLRVGDQPMCDTAFTPTRLRRAAARVLAVFAALVLAACSSVEDQRIANLLHERGFGSRAQGVAPAENYVAGGDMIQFVVDPTAQLTPGAEMLTLLTVPQVTGIDGTILLPYLGTVYVLGKTERELASMVTEQLEKIFTFPIRLHARIFDRGKDIYVFGETVMRGRIDFFFSDVTLLDFVSRVGWTQLANLGRVRLVRPDAQNPLIVEVNLREMIETGYTTYNLRLQENDIIIVPPTFFGALTRFVQKLLEPLRVVVQAMFGLASVEVTYDILTNRNNIYGGFGFGRF